jgi:endonuclease YncB( thermonuclease family)
MRAPVLALLIVAACLAGSAEARCPMPPATRHATTVLVIDGDTLLLGSGERLRLVGIDAPELGQDGEPDEPFAADAKSALQGMIESSEGEIRLLPGREPRDRYGRRLAHVYGRNGGNLNELLLRAGLAYEVTIPPNDRFSTCYLQAEADARLEGLGLWTLPPLKASRLPPGREGFERIAGRVEAVRHAKRATWIDLQGPLTLRIVNEDLHRFDRAVLAALPGSQIQVRGWLYHYRGYPRMRLRHPSALLIP